VYFIVSLTLLATVLKRESFQLQGILTLDPLPPHCGPCWWTQTFMCPSRNYFTVCAVASGRFHEFLAVHCLNSTSRWRVVRCRNNFTAAFKKCWVVEWLRQLQVIAANSVTKHCLHALTWTLHCCLVSSAVIPVTCQVTVHCQCPQFLLTSLLSVLLAR